MSDFVQLVDNEGNPFIARKNKIDLAFIDENGQTVIVFNETATQIQESFEEVGQKLL